MLPARGRRLPAIALAVALACGSGSALALSIGLPNVQTYLGQPLRMRVPVKIDDPGEANPQCLRLIPAHQSDGVPTLTHGKLTLEGMSDGASALRITTWQPVLEPVLRVIVEAGCQRRMRREFTLLLDPPPVAETMLAAAPAGQVALAAPPALHFGTPQIHADRSAVAMARPPVDTAAAAKREAPRKKPSTKPTEKPATPTLTQSGSTPGVTPHAARRADRLVLSSPEDTAPAPIAPAEDAANREAVEVAREREAEILRRVDDLASEVRRLRAERDAANARNRELTAKSKSNGYAWTAGGRNGPAERRLRIGVAQSAPANAALGRRRKRRSDDAHHGSRRALGGRARRAPDDGDDARTIAQPRGKHETCRRRAGGDCTGAGNDAGAVAHSGNAARSAEQRRPGDPNPPTPAAAAKK
ncbi:MAG TPA: hypothetical protein VFR86_07650 [Burkholderiaceae bacterium]|nr:hypothetical protein [Burkholderiaceae bacterium]